MQYPKKLQRYIALGVVLHLLHGIEIVNSGFISSHPDAYLYTKWFHSIPEAVYYVQHAGLYITLVCILCFVIGKKWVYIPLLFFGYLLIAETHHIVGALLTLSYTEGMCTSILFVPLTYLYLRELSKLNIHKSF